MVERQRDVRNSSPSAGLVSVDDRHALRLGGAGGEFATTLLEVRDRDVDGLSLVLKPGASISGRIVAEAGTASPPSVGVRVSASPVSERYAMSRAISARVAPDGTFRMSGLSGSYQFTVSADKEPYVQATRVVTGGRESPATDGVEFVDGDHEVVVFVAPRAPRKSTVDNHSRPKRWWSDSRARRSSRSSS